MKLVIGGAYQGKLKFAESAYQLTEGWADGNTCEPEMLWDCTGITDFHMFVKRMLSDAAFAEKVGKCMGFSKEQAENVVSLETQAALIAQCIYRKNPEIVIISNELGYGVVPMEKADRIWREMVGRICTVLAEQSDEVVRVVCGLGMRLK